MAFFMTGMVLGGCGQTTVYAAELAYESVEFEEHSETEETGIEEAGIEESGTDESDPDEIQSEENAEETEPEETEDSEEKNQDKANLSDGKSEEEDKENENKKKTPNFTVNVVTDESTVKAGSVSPTGFPCGRRIRKSKIVEYFNPICKYSIGNIKQQTVSR